MIALKSGKPYPLGATITDDGVNFAVFSENAEPINLEIFRSIYDSEPAEIIELKEKTAHVWHVLVPGLKSGALYGYRAAINFHRCDFPYEIEIEYKDFLRRTVLSLQVLLYYIPSNC